MRNSGGGSMLSFEVILQVFEDILRQNPFCEVVSNSHGYMLLHRSRNETLT